jgi:hypothetical protein
MRCSIVDCKRSTEESGAAKGMCSKHYQRSRRRGDGDPTEAQARVEGGAVGVSFRIAPELKAKAERAAKREKLKPSDWFRDAVAEKLSKK